MSKNDFWVIKVPEWDRHNAKQNRQKYYLMDCRMHKDPKFLSLSVGARLAFLWILGEVATSTRREAWCRPTDLHPITGRKPPAIRSLLEELVSLQWIQILSGPNFSQDKISKDKISKVKLSPPGCESAPPAPPKKPPADIDLNRKIWEAYRGAYFGRYGKDPIRNATTNGQVAQFGKRLGEDAIPVAAFYLTHNEGFYLKKTHSFGLCLQDAESLHTQWVRDRKVTGSAVRQFEQSEQYNNLFEMIDKGEI